VKEAKVDPAEPRPTEAGGRRGLEPRTSALIDPERCADDSRESQEAERQAGCYVVWGPSPFGRFLREAVPKVPGRRYGLHDLGFKSDFVATLA
jgi:hypothetical protein